MLLIYRRQLPDLHPLTCHLSKEKCFIFSQTLCSFHKYQGLKITGLSFRVHYIFFMAFVIDVSILSGSPDVISPLQVGRACCLVVKIKLSVVQGYIIYSLVCCIAHCFFFCGHQVGYFPPALNLTKTFCLASRLKNFKSLSRSSLVWQNDCNSYKLKLEYILDEFCEITNWQY